MLETVMRKQELHEVISISYNPSTHQPTKLSIFYLLLHQVLLLILDNLKWIEVQFTLRSATSHPSIMILDLTLGPPRSTVGA